MQTKSDTLQSWVLNSASFFANTAISMMALSLVYYLRSVFLLTPSQIGVGTSVSTFSYLIGCLCLARLVSAMKPRYAVALALVGMGSSLLLFVRAHLLWVAYLGLALYGVFMSMLWPSIEAWFSRGKEGEALNKASNSFNFSWSFAAGVSTLFAGLLVEVSVTLAFWVGIAMLFGLAAYVSLFAHFVPGMRALPSENVSRQETVQEDHSTPLRFFCWAGIVLVYTGMSVVQNIFPLYAQDELGISESMTGLLLLIRGVATCFTFVFLAKTHFWQFSRKTILFSQLGFALVCFWGAMIRSALVFGLCFLAFGVVFAFGYSLSMFHGVAGCQKRARRMAIHEILLTVGQITGSVAGGAIYQYQSFSRILSVYGAIALVVVCVESFIRTDSPKRG
jgi:predicted MFS family arabinose efflux permease